MRLMFVAYALCMGEGRGREELGLPRDGPDEARELARHRGDRLLSILAATRQASVPRVESLLRLPRDRAHVRGDSVVTLLEVATHLWSESVVPGTLDECRAYAP